MSIEHPRRRRFLALGLVALAAVLLLGMTLSGNHLGLPGGTDDPTAAPPPWTDPDYANSGTVGDTDTDGKVSPEEADVLEQAEASAASVREVIAPKKGVDTVLLTPGGDDWWTFVVSQAPGLGLTDSEAPADVDWYATTEGRTYKSASEYNAYYQAVHVAFPAPEAAASWVEGLAANGYGSASTFAMRGRVVTITPAWVDANTEPYPDVDEGTLETIETDLALWQVDFSAQAENRAREASDPVAYAAFWKATGITGTWTATSPRPDVPWVGTLDGFDADAVDVAAVGAHINTSMYACGRDRECRGDQGISKAISALYMSDGTGAGLGEVVLAPEDVEPGDLPLVLVLDGQFRGLVNESFMLDGLAKTEYLVDEAGTLTLRLTFTEAGSGADTS